MINVEASLENLANAIWKLERRIELIEGLPPKVEQTQPPVRQQDAALTSDEPPGSAAGNPDDRLSKFRTYMEAHLDAEVVYFLKSPYGRPKLIEEYKSVLRWLDSFDKEVGDA